MWLCFTVVNEKKNCPKLHVPSNGYLACFDTKFGRFCTPTCDENLVRFPEKTANTYSCRGGRWVPDDKTGDCAGIYTIKLKIVFCFSV